ncbi:enoyl-CoA hydratase/isomerase family protein [Arthrobacter sp. ISL-28]|uniref:enoyl-CoA hydratase/isomerase family protein n=1 Tax=Arthrobacter sp. ISL-28 TaxID=2819108 RepID=UPI001BE91BD5|nr:enoyl-CoA hydratase-related protein [Arthrobacter sp. ISL-28]MBT2523317.1 enoyl-CoA hydratase/isomerase family protein [Arthrobacter sp. ISL-28]
MSAQNQPPQRLFETTTLSVTRHDPVVVVALDRPDARNAVNGVMLAELAEVLAAIAADPEVRALLLTGNGPVFCAGADIKDAYYDDSPEAQSARVDLGYSVVRALRDLPFPTVCAINGACVAIGLSLALLCDVRVAAEDAKLIFGFAQIGMVPDFGAASLLGSLLGPLKALELVVLDEPVDAGRSRELGFVSRVTPVEQLRPVAFELATRLADRSGAATRLTRTVLRDFASLPFEKAFKIEAEVVKDQIRSPDFLEGLTAARERRTPRFSQR